MGSAKAAAFRPDSLAGRDHAPGQLLHPESVALNVAAWSRDEIETAIETLIELLDAADAPGEDLEPDAECGRGDLLLGDPADAE